MKKKSTITAEGFDKLFDEGKKSILPYMDLENIRRPNQEQKRVNVDFPQWVINRLDAEAAKMGVTRQSIIKFWIADKISQLPTQ